MSETNQQDPTVVIVPYPKKELYAALAKAQGQIRGAVKDSTNPHFKSSYADLASVWEACRKALSDNGLCIIQQPVAAPAGFVALETTLGHSSGESVTSRFSMPVAQANNAQAIGSALTYARRYALSAFVGIAPEDDDGNGATNGGPVRSQPGSSQVPQGAKTIEQVRKQLNGGK